jgi:hypothetical protein
MLKISTPPPPQQQLLKEEKVLWPDWRLAGWQHLLEIIALLVRFIGCGDQACRGHPPSPHSSLSWMGWVIGGTAGVLRQAVGYLTQEELSPSHVMHRVLFKPPPPLTVYHSYTVYTVHMYCVFTYSISFPYHHWILRSSFTYTVLTQYYSLTVHVASLPSQSNCRWLLWTSCMYIQTVCVWSGVQWFGNFVENWYSLSIFFEKAFFPNFEPLMRKPGFVS